MTEDLKELIEAQIEAKKNQELERIEKQIKQDKEVITKAIDLINTHTLYKKVVDSSGHYVYKLATEEMFKKDYLKEPKYTYERGVKFHLNAFDVGVNKGIIEVNGENYYDICYALNTYENNVKNLRNSLKFLEELIKEKEKDLEILNAQFPTLKKAIEEWQTYEKENK